jgi:hypothetical protein
VDFRNSVEFERRKTVSYIGYLTALTESHSQCASDDIKGYINVYTVSEIRSFKMAVR